MPAPTGRVRRTSWLVPATLRARLALAFLVTNLVVVGIAVLMFFLVSQATPTPGGPGLDALLFVIVVSLGIAAAAGLSVGLIMTSLIRRPLESLASTLGKYGHEALEGHSPGTLPVERYLPEEFHSLVDVFESVLDHLARRQSELLSAEQAAEASARNLAFAVVDSSEMKLLVQGGAIVIANPAASLLLGVPAAELMGAPGATVFDRLRITTGSSEELTSAQLIETALDGPVQVCIERADGSHRWAEVRTVAQEDGEHTLLVTARDITEQRRAQGLRAEVISLISHDLRAPLTVIAGYLDLLERPLDDERREAAVSSAQRSAQRMSELLEDILSATRAEELFAPSSFAPVRLASLAQDTVGSLEHTAAHRMSVRVLSPGLVLGEERRLRQALVNLVSNAIRHTPATGEIVVTVERIGEHVRLSVEDDGPGIPVADRELVFERFTRLGADTDNTPGGFGLGLYIVKVIAESHGGRVRIEDADGESGARLVITLPAAPEPE